MPTRRTWKLLLLFVLVSLATRGMSLAIDVVDMDEAAHAVGSWVLRDGGLLYRDFVDNKPPLVYVYYAAAQRLFGDGLVRVRLFTLLLTIPLTALAASAFYRHDRRGLAAALLYLVWSAAFIGHDVLATNSELLLLLPASWAVVMLADRERAGRPLRLGLSGALLGAAFLFKFHAAAWLPALAAAAVRATRGRRERGFAVLALLGGFALPLVATVAYFAVRGGVRELVYWSIGNIAAYSANPIPPGEALGRAAGTMVPFLMVTAPLTWLWLRSGTLDGDRHQARLAAALVLLSLLAAGWGLRFYIHYLVPVYWPLALAAAPAAAALASGRARAARVLAALTLVLWLGFTLSTAVLYFAPPGGRVYRETDPVFSRVTDRLRRDACFEGGSLFVWGYAPIFYYDTRLRPASRFVALSQARLTGYVSGNLASLAARGPDAPGAVAEHWDWLFADLEHHRATYVLDTAPAGIYRWDRYPLADFPRLREYLDGRYERLDAIEGVVIYRRRGCRGRATSGGRGRCRRARSRRRGSSRHRRAAARWRRPAAATSSCR